MSALVEVHAHKCIAGLKDRKLDSKVCRCAGMRLNIGISASEELLGTLNSDCLDYIDHLTSAIIALSGISFRILICKRAAHSCHNSFACPVLGCDQFDMIVLTLHFLLDGCSNFRIDPSDFFN